MSGEELARIGEIPVLDYTGRMFFIQHGLAEFDDGNGRIDAPAGMITIEYGGRKFAIKLQDILLAVMGEFPDVFPEDKHE